MSAAARESLIEARDRTFTRDEILAALTIAPCHITGTHDPQHTPKYICTYQRKDALQGLLDLLGVTAVDLPRKPHTYPASKESGVLEDAWVNKRPMTFTASILPGETWPDFDGAWEAACDARKASRENFTVSAITNGLDEPVRVAYW